MRGSTGWALSLLLASGGGCSLWIDTEPDCDAVRDCGGHLCNAERTGCESTCDGDLECVEGFACDTGSRGCVRVVRLLGDPVRLEPLASRASEIASAADADGVSVASGGPLGLTFARFASTGERLATPGDVAPTGALLLAPPSPTGQLFDPSVSIRPGGRASVAWVEEGGGRSKLQVASFDGTWNLLPVATARDANQQTSLSDVQARFAAEGGLALWREQSGSQVSLQAIALDAETFAPLGVQPTRLTAVNESAEFGQLGRVGDTWLAVAAVTQGGSRTVRAHRVGPTGELAGRLDLRPLAPTSSFEVVDAAFGAEGSTGLAAWSEARAGRRVVVVAAIDAATAARIGSNAQASTPVEITGELNEASRLTVAFSGAEAAVAWFEVTAAGDRRIAVRRIDAAGQPLSPVGAAVEGLDRPASSVRLSSTGDGYVLNWTLLGDDGLELWSRRLGRP